MNRCTGHCCRRFPLPAPLEEIERRRNADVCPPNEKWIQDGDKLAAMLIPLGRDGEYADGSPRYYFTCKHLTPAGDCADYENRPRMCRDYPYGRECEMEGCTAEARGVSPNIVPAHLLVMPRSIV